jgi:hypothetical protein
MKQPKQNFFQEVLDDAIAHLGPALTSEPAVLKHTLGRLPPAPYGMLEVPLQPGAVQVDFSQGFRQREYPLITSWLQQSGIPSEPGLQRFIEALNVRSGSQTNGISGIGLEFDLDSQAPERLSIPNLFFVMDREQVKDHATTLKVLHGALTALFDDQTCEAMLSNSKGLINSLPSGSRVKTAGVMLARTLQSLRLQIAGVSLKALPDILQQPSAARLPATLSDATTLADEINLPTFICLDLAPTLLPRVGMEINGIGRDRPDALSKTLDLLVDNHLCCAQKRKDIENWTGVCTPASFPVEWVASQLQQPAERGNRHFVSLRRQVSHIKLMSCADEPLAAKAYLEFYPVIEILT